LGSFPFLKFLRWIIHSARKIVEKA
jgi:hypothetical protein